MVDVASAARILEAVATIVTTAAPIVMQGYSDGKDFAELIYRIVKGETITDAEIDEILAKANALSARIQSPNFIPPEKDDDL